MPQYTYLHTGQHGPDCDETFVVEQAMRDPALASCPACGGAVVRQIGTPIISVPAGASKLRNLGMSKLVRRDKGVYENVSAQEGEKRIITEGDLGGKAPGA